MDIPWFTTFVLPWCVAAGALVGFYIQDRRQRRTHAATLAFAEAQRRIQAEQLDIMRQQLELARVPPPPSERLDSIERRMSDIERRSQTSRAPTKKRLGAHPSKHADPLALELRRQELQLKAAALEEKRIQRQLKTAKAVWGWVEDNL